MCKDIKANQLQYVAVCYFIYGRINILLLFFSNVWQGNRKKANKEEEKEKIYVFGIEQHGTDDD